MGNKETVGSRDDVRSSQGFLLNIAPRHKVATSAVCKIPNMAAVLLQSELVLVLEGECMGEQLPITWSPLVTGRYLHGPGLSRMADNSGHGL